jgi:hypothetical protein
MVATVAHVPWLFTYLRLIPGATRPQERIIALAQEYVKRRLDEGSNIKDLFYHLMRKVHCSWASIFN